MLAKRYICNVCLQRPLRKGTGIRPFTSQSRPVQRKQDEYRRAFPNHSNAEDESTSRRYNPYDEATDTGKDETSSFKRNQRPQKQQLTKEEKERFRGMFDSLFAISNRGRPPIARTVRHPTQIKKTDLPPLKMPPTSSKSAADETQPSSKPSPRYALRNSPLTRGRSQKYWSQNTWEQRPRAETLEEFSQKVDHRYQREGKQEERRSSAEIISAAIDSCQTPEELLAWTQDNFLSLAVTDATPYDSVFEEILEPARNAGPGLFHSWPKIMGSDLPTCYSTILRLIIRRYRLHFMDARMANNIFELVARGLGPQSYLLGCDADVYTEMLKVAWFGDWEGISKGTASFETVGVGMGREPMNLKLVESLLLRAESTGVYMHSNLRRCVENIVADVEEAISEDKGENKADEQPQVINELKWDDHSLQRLRSIKRLVAPVDEFAKKRVYNVH